MSVSGERTPESLVVEYQLAHSDVEAYMVRHQRQGLSRRVLWAALWAAIGAFVGVVAVLQGGGTRYMLVSAVMFAASAGIVVFGVKWLMTMNRRAQRWARIAIEHNPGLILPMTIEVTPEGVASANDLSQSFRSWVLFTSVTVEGKYIYITQRDGNALFIPRRAFASVDDFREFADQAEAWRASNVET